MNYLKFSKKRRAEADEILKKTDLFNQLKKLGEVRSTGSYSFDLMIKPDIDFVIRVKNKNEVDKIIKKIAALSKKIDKIRIKKIVDRKKWKLNGKSIHLIYHDKEEWGIDILVTIDDFSSYNKLDRKLKDKMTYAKKKAILKLKYYFYKKKMKAPGTTYGIYTAVLDKNIRDIEDYLSR